MGPSRSVTPSISPGHRLLDELVQEGAIQPGQRQQVLTQEQLTQARPEDLLIDLGIVSEAQLLKHIAGRYKTRFVSTEKLAKASITRATLNLVPRKVAERLLAFPILFDGRTETLSVVAADLDEHDVEKQVQLVSNAREVKVYVARPAAIRSLIRKHYGGDARAFAPEAKPTLELGGNAYDTPGFGHHVGGLDAGGGYGGGGNMYGDVGIDTGAFDLGTLGGAGTAARPGGEGDSAGLGPAAAIPGLSADGITGQVSVFGLGDPPPSSPPTPVFTIEAPDIMAELRKVSSATGDGVGLDDYVETLNVMVALLERDRSTLRGHSALVVRLCRKLGERIGLERDQLQGILVAACLHDLGKASSYHLTPLNVAQYEGHRTRAQRTYMTPVRIFESIELPKEAVLSLTHMYERADGKGFPDHLAGKEIPLGARMLGIVETYVDLTSHAKNPYRKALSPKEACDVLLRYRDRFFDGNIVDIFRQVVLGEDLKTKLLSERSRILVVDADPEETTVLELRLAEHGFEVLIARSATVALEVLDKEDVDAIVSEVELEPLDGFQLFEKVRAGQRADLPWVFLTMRDDRESVSRGFSLGAADYLVKPAAADVVAAKLGQLLSSQTKTAQRGVSGSLREMSLPDVVQVLSNGRKSGCLTIKGGGAVGEVLFGDGAIFDASFGTQRGEDAVYAMLRLTDGSFELDTTKKPSERRINQSTEGLLLEGMRRLDEGIG